MRRRNALRVMRLAVLLLALAIVPAQAGSVGFSTASVPDPPGEPLKVGIWYPTDVTGADQDIGLFTQAVAPDAPVDGGGHPMIVFSHGNGGSLEGHYDTALALAQAGFVVAAMTHTGDNYRDHSRELYLADRARAVHAVIGYMLASWPGHAAVDPDKVGMFGFSAGGFTALVSAGGIPDLSKIAPYCAGHGDTFVCRVIAAHPADSVPSIRPGEWIADPRIKAAAIAAPALGFVFSAQGLRNLLIPVQLWRAEDDHVLPSPDYVEPVRDALPRPPEYHVVAGADHFDFLAPCSEQLTFVAPEICREHGGFDRAAFHEAFDRNIVRFFRQALNP